MNDTTDFEQQQWNRRRKQLQDIMTHKLKVTCQYPMKGGCPEEVIQSHSIQGAGPVSLLADATNHIKVLDFNVQANVPVSPIKDEAELLEAFSNLVIDVKDEGINCATTFPGLCSKHDSELFKPIETVDPDPSKSEHLFKHSERRRSIACTTAESMRSCSMHPRHFTSSC